MGYHWPSMFKDAHAHARRCPRYQAHTTSIHQPASELHSIVTPWPFSTWGLDLVGTITPASSNGHRWILTATEYFTKWAEAVPLSSTTGTQITRFILQNIICRFGVPHTIITDNGSSFCNSDMDELCEQFRIAHRTSSPYYPQANGQVEAFNKILVNILKKTVSKSMRDWHTQLFPALWAYRTSIRTATGMTPFSLVYGTEAVLPLEVEIPSLRVSLAEFTSEEWRREARLLELEQLDENRLHAYQNNIASKQQAAEQYRKKLRPRHFAVGEKVLKQDYTPDKLHKFEEKWTGPYVIVEDLNNGAYHIADLEGRELRNSVNAQYLRKFYL